MSEGSRFAGLSRRARALLGSADPAVLAIATEELAPGADEATGAAPASPPPPAPAPPPPPPPPSAATEADEAAEAAAAEAEATIRADQSEQERQRVTDVFASDEAKGKERLAARLLANPKLEAADIVAMLPDLGADASDGMLANLATQPNPNLGAGKEAGGENAQADAAKSWDRTFERLGWAGDKK